MVQEKVAGLDHRMEQSERWHLALRPQGWEVMWPQGEPLTGKGSGSDQEGPPPGKPVALTRKDHEFHSKPLKSEDCGLWGGTDRSGFSGQFCMGLLPRAREDPSGEGAQWRGQEAQGSRAEAVCPVVTQKDGNSGS